MNYRLLNNLTGWAVFAVALLVYLLTVAPTASFWDCGEFIACANELEVTHPPGAPLFLLLGRIFAMFAFGNVGQIAFMVNLVSVLASAFTALFTFWTITRLASLGSQQFEMEDAFRTPAILLAGVVGGLTCIFADSIWFNAVEAEVYALSSFFTALVVWLMLKWEARADEADHLRWILLIAYVMGLSIGVHLLNLLTIPVLALLYYFRKFPFSWKGLLATLGISVVLLAFIQYGIIQYTFDLAWQFERFFTGTETRTGDNSTGMGLPMGTGFVLMFLLILLSVIALLVYSHRKGKAVLNTVVLGYLLIMIGFSSYGLIFIRSQANPPIDMNNPENLLTFLSYMKREQYGDRPLMRGPLYSARPMTERRGEYEITKFEVEGTKYLLLPGRDKYVEDMEIRRPVYASKDKVWFPRMWEAGRYQRGPFGYTHYVSRKGARDEQGKDRTPYDDQPTRWEDFQFFLDYQLNHMYFRYFMWNFAGRASDNQDDSWESGFESKNIRQRYADNKGKNHYYFIPLFLGLLGFFWQSSTDPKRAAVVGLLFFFTGIAIIIYLNQYPAQPRERDYSFAGSFQTFCIWVGLGVMFLTEVLRKYLKSATPWVVGGIALLAPLLMAQQNWDDHSRKGRWIDIEFAWNLLQSCAPNGILFTGGDNDTFPLWYLQEVEGVRTDVRVVNMELLTSDWYISQVGAPQNGTPGVPLSLNPDSYAGDLNQVIRGNYRRTIYLPAKPAELLAKGILSPSEASRADSLMAWYFRPDSGNYLFRNDSVVLDIMRTVASQGWERPVYFANTMPPSNYLDLVDYFHLEGMAYRVLPVKKRETETSRYFDGDVRQEVMQKNLLEKFRYTGLNDPSVHLDDHIRSVILGNYRSSLYRLCNSYADDVAALGRRQAEDSVERAALQAVISSRQSLLSQALGYFRQQVPDSVQPRELIDAIRMGQLVYRSGLRDAVADHEIAYLQEQLMPRLSLYKNAGKPLDQNANEFRGALIVIQYLAEQKRVEEARYLATLLEEVSGQQGIGRQLLE